MRSVERRFSEFAKMYPHHSSLIVFGRAVKGQGFSRRMVAFYFNKCVDKADYPRGEKKDFIRFYQDMTSVVKSAEDGIKQGQKGPVERVSPYFIPRHA